MQCKIRGLVWTIIMAAVAAGGAVSAMGDIQLNGVLAARVDGNGVLSEVGGLGVSADVSIAGGRVVKAGVQGAAEGVVVTREVESNDHRCTLRQTFAPTDDGVRWSVEITGIGEPWSAPIEVTLRGVPKDSRFWTTWADPNSQRGWNDPLVTMPMRNLRLWYGQPSFENDPSIGFLWRRFDSFSVPLAMIAPPGEKAISLVLSPDDTLLDMSLETTRDGTVRFTHLHHRITPDRPVRFTMDLVQHEPDWRASLGWMVENYAEYFNPPNPWAHNVAGTGAYSWYEGELDAPLMHQMAFRVNWKASFDFPYMGMFLPPLEPETEWINFRDKSTSIKQVSDYSTYMDSLGFHVLNYFNVTEFGTAIKFPAPEVKDATEPVWKDANRFLFEEVADGILYASDEKSPFYSWFRCIAMDPGGPKYADFLMEQAMRHLEQLPDSAGFCIDRTDWLRFYNPTRDDGVAWAWGKPVASLFVSWRQFLARLGAEVHEKQKLIYINNAMARVDLMKDVDGMFDEFTFIGGHLNKCAFECVNKPLIGWIEPRQDEFWTTPDAFMQQNLYMGCYPMAPFPGNDHSSLPHPDVEQLFRDYGPLMDAMRGKHWVLLPNVIEVPGGEAKANLFRVPGQLVIPVINAKADRVRVVIHGIPRIVKADGFEVDALHPGLKKAAKVKVERKGNDMVLDVPIVRGCAMVRMKHVWSEPAPTYFFDKEAITLHVAVPDASIGFWQYPQDMARSFPNSYDGPIELHESTTLSAGVWGEISDTRATFTKVPLPPVRIESASRVFEREARVTLWCSDSRPKVVYTLDGSEPTAGSTCYTGPISIKENTTVRARTVLDDATPGTVSEASFYCLPPRPPTPEVHLSDLAPVKATVGWGGRAKMDLSIQGGPLMLQGERYEKGMGVHAVSELAYPLKPEYRRFVAVVGIDDRVVHYPGSSAVFQVWIDGKLAVASPVLSVNERWYFDVEIPTGSKTIQLKVTDGGDSNYADHADWADAGFVR